MLSLHFNFVSNFVFTFSLKDVKVCNLQSCTMMEAFSKLNIFIFFDLPNISRNKVIL